MTRRIAGIFLFFLLTGCGGNNNPSSFNVTGINAVGVALDPSSLCGGIANNPCVQVTICQPGTSNCQAIGNITLDTGSSGLRIFRSVLAVQLPQMTDSGGNPIGECALFADLSADWGPVQIADVGIGGEPPVTVPVQVIDSTFGGPSAGQNACGPGVNISQTPGGGFSNGTLGVSFFQYDPGPYFSCRSTSCTGTTVPLPEQVQNPVFLLPVDNNGIILSFPSVPGNGSPSLSGSLTFGINTRSNNGVSGGISVYPADTSGYLTTFYKNTLYPNSIIDSGTNVLAVPDSSIPQCLTKGSSNGFLCPPSPLSLSASNKRGDGAFLSFLFQIANADTLFSANNLVFNDLGFISTSSFGFDWGFPFFIGRTVYLGFEGRNSPLGTGPFWAY
ncbi:MAG: DUF3443 family protein [Nitrospiria bacterium]